MKKLILLLCFLASVPLVAQKKTFTAACLNVDGLPPAVKAAGVYNVKLNPEGPQESGTLQMSQLVRQKGWDFFGVSENFNYNDQLMSEISSKYTSGTYRGPIPTSVTNVIPYLSGSKWFDTDGLNLLWQSGTGISAYGEEWYLWNQRNGITNDGADQLIAKGFRYYTVSVGAGLEIDVYILHMDAETTDADNAAREVQMTQLVDMILASNNKRPIIIMGDTNCRYTRDNLKGLMFERINADSRFTIQDPWIEFPRQGVMPELGTGSIMVPDHFDGTNHDAFQTGEVVDKVFYINNTDAPTTLKALSYLQDTEFTWPDGSEISDHYPIVIEFEIENPEQTLTGGEFYMRNVKTGQFVAAGGQWGTQGVVARTGNRLTLEPTGTEGEFYILTTCGNLGDNLFMDNGTKCKYTFTRIQDASTDDSKKYTVTLNGNALTVDNNNVLQTAAVNTDDVAQQWELLSPQQLTNYITHNASEANPLDATYFIKGANFNRNDSDVDAWSISKSSKVECNLKDGLNTIESGNFVGQFYNDKIYTGRSDVRVSQNISGLPNGKYKISFQGFMRDTNNNEEFFVQFNDKTVGFKDISDGAQTTQQYKNTDKGEEWRSDVQSNGKWVPNSMQGAAVYFNMGLYTSETELTIADGKLNILINKPHTTSSTWTVFDNFVLTYLGPTAEDLAALNRVEAAINDAQAKADALGLTSYSNRAVVDAWENRHITGNGDTEIHDTYTALAKAAIKQNKFPADVTYAILNNSFEMGSFAEWDVSGAQGALVADAPAEGADGLYIATANGGTIKWVPAVTMPSGLYTLTATLSPGAVLFAGGREVTAAGDGDFVEVNLNFLLTDGTTDLGVRGDGAFKADNFRLTRQGDSQTAIAYEMLQTAINEATARATTLPEGYAKQLDLSAYQAMIDNFTLTGDGIKEFNEVFGKLRQLVYQQGAPENGNADAALDYTAAIINPDFELGNTLGWDVNFVGDTGVKELQNKTYTTSAAHGTYVFNTYDGGKGTTLSQTITGLPSGHYRLWVVLSSDQNKCVSISANDSTVVRQMERDFKVGSDYTMDFDVADNTEAVTITVKGANDDGTPADVGGAWYKADNFRLYRHGDDQKNTCAFYTRLQTAIRRLATLAAKLPDPYRTQWDAHDYQDLIDRHINSDHSEDPMHSNGQAEIEELYTRFRKLVFSQTETGADMSGAITNQSFELGDLTGWNTDALPSSDTKVTKGNLEDVYNTRDLDGEYLFNSYEGGKSVPLTATLKNIPAGIYRLSALVASDNGNKFYLAVDGKPGEMVTTADKGQFQPIAVEFEIAVDDSEVTIGLYPSLDGTFNAETRPLNLGPWFKVDNFGLELIGRKANIEWQMEYPAEGIGTLILPFDADIPEGLSVSTLTAATPIETVHHQAGLTQKATLVPQSKIAANTPYVVKSSGARNTGIYTFSGITTHVKSTYKTGLLTGTYTETTPATGELHLGQNDGNVGFIYHNADTPEHTGIQPYHAYVDSKVVYKDGADKELPFIIGLYLDDLAKAIEWNMDGAAYGTLVMPFDAEIPEGLEVYEPTEKSEVAKVTVDGTEVSYQIITLEPVTEILAHTPYIVMAAGAEVTPQSAMQADEAGEETPAGFVFNGTPTLVDQSIAEGQLLTGTYLDKDAAEGEYTLSDNALTTADGEPMAGFTRTGADSSARVAAYHAYYAGSPEDAPLLLFAEPETGPSTGVDTIFLDGNGPVDVYTISGVALRHAASLGEALEDLAPGLYILRSGSVSVKMLKR